LLVGRFPVPASNNNRGKETEMHYRNGREAQNGDKLVKLDMSNGKVVAFGVLYDATPGNGDHCNGAIASVPNETVACLCDCLHVDDLALLLKEKGLDRRAENQ